MGVVGRRLRAGTLVLVVLVSLSAAGEGLARPQRPVVSAGYDISWPQCGRAYPSRVLFGIVGVNGGLPFSVNPCLGGRAGELAWAERAEPVPILYVNTADPGPALSMHWPNGQASPQPCNTSGNLGPDTPQCSFDYGWNAAADSYADAVAAYKSLGQLPASATQTPQPDEWWLDVESANSWEQTTTNDVQALAGEVAYLQSQSVTAIGFYANSSDWATITGDTTAFAAFPSWLPGAGAERQAQTRCSSIGANGGRARYSQYATNGYDGDVRCY